jgi:hypothetical protein
VEQKHNFVNQTTVCVTALLFVEQALFFVEQALLLVEQALFFVEQASLLETSQR